MITTIVIAINNPPTTLTIITTRVSSFLLLSSSTLELSLSESSQLSVGKQLLKFSQRREDSFKTQSFA
jgi:hypothetical protein